MALQVLCFEVVTKHDMDWTLHYVAGAIAHTDTPKSLVRVPQHIHSSLPCAATHAIAIQHNTGGAH